MQPFVTCCYLVVRVDFVLPLYQVTESSGRAIVCLEKDKDTSIPFSVTVTPFETTPTMEDIYKARGASSLYECTYYTKWYNFNFHVHTSMTYTRSLNLLYIFHSWV